MKTKMIILKHFKEEKYNGFTRTYFGRVWHR